jgi:hypothetical protein
MAEAPTWDAPLVSSTYLDSYHLGWPLQGFPHVLNVIKEPLLGPLHSHTLYHTPINRSDVTSAHTLLQFARLLVGDAGSPTVRGTMQAIFVMERGENGSSRLIRDTGEALIVGESKT